MTAVTYERKGPIAYIGLNRPQSLNAFNPEMFDGFNAAIAQYRDDKETKVAIIHGGTSRAFCAGVDLKSLSKDLESGIPRPPYEIDLAHPTYLDKPVIAAIRGYCVGEGVHIALSCDIRVAASDAIFLVPENAVGIPLIRLSSQCVRTIGMSAAIDLCYLAEKKDASWALTHQLIHRVALPGEELAKAEKIAERLCSLSFDALRVTKQTMVRAHDLSYDKLLDFGLPLREKVLEGGDARKASRAFKEKGG